MIRLLERETRFLSTTLKINFSPYLQVKKILLEIKKSLIDMIRLLERETRFELATFSLEG